MFPLTDTSVQSGSEYNVSKGGILCFSVEKVTCCHVPLHEYS